MLAYFAWSFSLSLSLSALVNWGVVFLNNTSCPCWALLFQKLTFARTLRRSSYYSWFILLLVPSTYGVVLSDSFLRSEGRATLENSQFTAMMYGQNSSIPNPQYNYLRNSITFKEVHSCNNESLASEDLYGYKTNLKPSKANVSVQWFSPDSWIIQYLELRSLVLEFIDFQMMRYM